MNIFNQAFKKKRVEIFDDNGNIIFVDATINEEHVRTSQATMHDIENGEQISDHVIKKGLQLTLSGVISDDPINLESVVIGTGAEAASSLIEGVAGTATTGALSKLSGNLLKNTSGICKTAYDTFEQIYDQKIPCTIITGLATYKNMVMESLSMPRNPGTYRALLFTASFRQVNIATSETVTVEKIDESVKDSATPKKREGNKSTVTPGAEAESKGSSLLYKILN